MAEDAEVNVNAQDLRDQLDALWEKHLTLLDTYHQAQQQLARHLSSGFFDLAQATFKSTTRVRYGQEYYDDRMQAIRRFDCVLDQDVPCIELKSDVASSNKPTDDETSNKDTSASEDEKVSGQQPTPPATPLPHPEQEQSKEESDHQEAQDTQDKDSTKKPRDPLHWYGILVPPPLRACQKSFVSAIERPAIEAANASQALRHITLEIRKLRKDIKKAEKRSL